MITSAVISYLGSNERVKAKLGDLINKTTFEPADHQDVTYTLISMLQSLGSQKLPTSILGVDLIEEAKKAVKGLPTTKQPKVSTTHLNMEYSDSRGYYRMNLYGPDDGYKVTKVLPSCIAGKNSISNEIEAEVYEDAISML